MDFQGTGLVANETFSFLINDTIAANLTSGGGTGGGLNDTGPGDLILLNDTIVSNVATTGGGVAFAGHGQLVLQNTLVALDAILGEIGPDVATANGLNVTDYGGNFLGKLDGSHGFGLATLTGNPKIGPVLANGGPNVGTLAVHFPITTVAPLQGSPLVGGRRLVDGERPRRPTSVESPGRGTSSRRSAPISDRVDRRKPRPRIAPGAHGAASGRGRAADFSPVAALPPPPQGGRGKKRAVRGIKTIRGALLRSAEGSHCPMACWYSADAMRAKVMFAGSWSKFSIWPAQ